MGSVFVFVLSQHLLTHTRSGENFQEAIQRETSEEQLVAASSPQRDGVVKWLSTAIGLEYSM